MCWCDVLVSKKGADPAFSLTGSCVIMLHKGHLLPAKIVGWGALSVGKLTSTKTTLLPVQSEAKKPFLLPDSWVACAIGTSIFAKIAKAINSELTRRVFLCLNIFNKI